MTDTPTTPKVVYIAGPMTGIPDYNYPAFNQAEADLRAAGYDVLNPVASEQHNTAGTTQLWQWYMRHALAMVIRADAVAVLLGWENSRGATLEVHVAETLGLPVNGVTEWVAEAVAT
jgi:hypothetical protein